MNRRVFLGVLGVMVLATPVLAASQAQIAAGKSIYRQYCGSCHGAKAQGAPNWKKPDAKGELPAPPHDETGHTWRHSDAELIEMIDQGWRDPFNKTDRLTMPAFKGRLSAQQTQNVIDYLKTLWTNEQRQFQAEESRGQPLAEQQ